MTTQQLLMIKHYLEKASKGYVIGNKQLIMLSLENALEIVNKEIEKEYTINLGVLKMTEDRPTLIYYVQTVLNTFKRDQENGFYSRDRQYAINMLSAAIEHQNDIWNAAIEAAVNKVESAGNILLAHSIRELKK